MGRPRTKPLDYRERCKRQKIWVCNVCGSSRRIVAHHINGDRTDETLDNLLPLCSSCHAKAHKGRNCIPPINRLQKQLAEDMPLSDEVDDWKRVEVPAKVYKEASGIKSRRGHSTIGGSIQHMCQEGDYDV